METIRFSKIGAEDLNIGTGTFEVPLSNGRQATLNKINLATFITGLITDTNIFYASGTNAIGQDSLFTWDTDTTQLTVGTAGLVRIGSTGTASRSLHVAVAGDAYVRIENTDSGADAVLEFALRDSVKWNLACDDSDTDDLVLSGGSSVDTSTPYLHFFSDKVAIGINTSTANAFQDAGLTIDQGSADNHILSLKSSDVAHGVTDISSTDEYGYLTKFNSAAGGLLAIGISSGSVGAGVSGVVTTETTTTTDSSPACIEFSGFKKSGTSTAPLSNTGNIFSMRNSGTRVVLFKGDGDVYNSGGSTAMGTYDDYDDVALLQCVKGAMDKSYMDTLGSWVGANLEVLERGKVITRDGDNYFISQRGLRGLIIDAIRQLSWRIENVEGLLNA